MANFQIDTLPPWKQEAVALLPWFLPFRQARKLLIRSASGGSLREEYLAGMRLEVIWLGKRYLRNHFTHTGVEHIDPGQTYVITSLHFGQWGMYPASLYQQTGIRSQMIITGRNRRPDTPASYFWQRFGHRRQYLSGYPGSYSTDGFFHHTRRLDQGISQVSLLDVREQGLRQKEVAVDFMGGPYYLPKTVPLLAKRARLSILPYIGYYDLEQGKHRVSWFPPIPPRQRDSDTLQAIMACFQPTFERHPEFYFNVLEHHRTPWG